MKQQQGNIFFTGVFEICTDFSASFKVLIQYDLLALSSLYGKKKNALYKSLYFSVSRTDMSMLNCLKITTVSEKGFSLKKKNKTVEHWLLGRGGGKLGRYMLVREQS